MNNKCVEPPNLCPFPLIPINHPRHSFSSVPQWDHLRGIIRWILTATQTLGESKWWWWNTFMSAAKCGNQLALTVMLPSQVRSMSRDLSFCFYPDKSRLRNKGLSQLKKLSWCSECLSLPPKVFAMSPWNAKSLPPSPHKSRTNNPQTFATTKPKPLASPHSHGLQVSQCQSLHIPSPTNDVVGIRSYIMQLTLFLHSRAQVAAGREKVVKSNLEGSRKRINQQKGGPMKSRTNQQKYYPAKSCEYLKASAKTSGILTWATPWLHSKVPAQEETSHETDLRTEGTGELFPRTQVPGCLRQILPACVDPLWSYQDTTSFWIIKIFSRKCRIVQWLESIQPTMPHQYIGLQTIAQFREKEFACFPSCVEIWQAGFRSPRFKGSLTANIPCFLQVGIHALKGSLSTRQSLFRLLSFEPGMGFTSALSLDTWCVPSHSPMCHPCFQKIMLLACQNTITISGNTLIVSLGYVSSNLGSSNQSHHHCSFW